MTSLRYQSQIVDGILLVNKPPILTSNAVLQQVKRIFRAKKAGHTGSLDPLATGMLPVCFGEATKFCQYLLDADKCYEVTGLLGIKTNTADSMGEVIARVDDFVISEDQLSKVLSEFSGPIKQIPSMFSALKHQGTPLYKLARAGIEIERKARDISIHQLKLNEFDGRQIKLTVTCSKGTYIRNLIEDIGERLGVGAHVTRLHRCFTAGFSNEPMYTLDELESKSDAQQHQCLLPMDRAVHDLPKIALSDTEVQALRQGKVISNIDTKALFIVSAKLPNHAYPAKAGIHRCNQLGASVEMDSHLRGKDTVAETINKGDAKGFTGCIRLYENDTQFIGLGELQEDGLKVKRLLVQRDVNDH